MIWSVLLYQTICVHAESMVLEKWKTEARTQRLLFTATALSAFSATARSVMHVWVSALQ